jgi:hypothetical protein
VSGPLVWAGMGAIVVVGWGRVWAREQVSVRTVWARWSEHFRDGTDAGHQVRAGVSIRVVSGVRWWIALGMGGSW